MGETSIRKHFLSASEIAPEEWVFLCRGIWFPGGLLRDARYIRPVTYTHRIDIIRDSREDDEILAISQITTLIRINFVKSNQLKEAMPHGPFLSHYLYHTIQHLETTQWGNPRAQYQNRQSGTSRDVECDLTRPKETPAGNHILRYRMRVRRS